ncbi:hypothetical protein OPV22_006583 [Ensete ventricosum]|uniref:Uncharacterized protein n=1 Tax=Ensete ventricosum TaxID=4639 RepID=A0AAV8RLN1_ENSVE|nr:hypothetical protein OPV22_006583 [Ensete ventricosum]RWW06283.1 hypothetical protein GW17_00030401 [Ensete ventricosum]
MGFFSWVNKIKTAVPSLGNLNSPLRSDHPFRRLLSFGSSNGRNEGVVAAETELRISPATAAASPDLEAPVIDGVQNSRTTVGMEAQPDNPAAAADTRQDSRTIAELAVPAILSVGVYSSVPSDVQLHHDGLPLYYPFLAMTGLGVGLSLYIIVYALAKSNGGGQEIEFAKRKGMRVAIVFFLIEFVLRILLLQVHWD